MTKIQVVLFIVAAGWSCRVLAQADVPEWVSFRDREWEMITSFEAGLDVDGLNAWVAGQRPRFGKAYGGQTPNGGGVVIARGGYILHTWGDPDFKYQSASLGKAFTRMTLQLAVDDRLVKNSTDLVRDYWTGDGLLASHKVMTRGHNANVSFHHLQKMKAGFPVSNGYLWRTKDASGIMGPKVIPPWAATG